ncbi:hypothetical protein HRbin10_01246 [bacterium HR10]|nr:hypothetical protein HRbin10_01246 [bacterium HR10]
MSSSSFFSWSKRGDPSSQVRSDAEGRRLGRAISIGGLIAALILAGAGGRGGRLLSRAAQDVSAGPSPLPFSEGERLVYQARYSKLILSAVVGRLTFTFGRSSERPLIGVYHLRAEAVSEGALMTLLGIRVEDVFESFVDPQDFGVLRTRKHLAEGAKRSFHLALFDRANASVTYIVRDLTRPTDPPSVKENAARPWVQDILSGIYYVRTQPLVPGSVLRFPVSDEGETYDLEVRVHEVEEVETPRGRVSALKIEPLIFGPGRLIRREGEMFVWLSADARRVPVLARVRGGFGTVQVQLVEDEPGAAAIASPEPRGGDVRPKP